MGEERKTVDNCFSRTKSTKQREMKQGYALSTFRLCDLTGHVELKTVCPKGTGVRIPLPAPKNKDTPCECPLFFATVRGDELSFAKRNGEFAYRRHIANLEAQSIRGICVARRCLSQVILCGTLSTILTPSSIPLFQASQRGTNSKVFRYSSSSSNTYSFSS